MVYIIFLFFFRFSTFPAPTTSAVRSKLQRLAVKQKWVVLSGCSDSTTKIHVTPHAAKEVHFRGKQEHVAN